MKIKLYLLSNLLWIYCIVPIYGRDESISFSKPTKININWEYSTSYWYGKIAKNGVDSIFVQGITMDLYINKPQGLLFYIIDNKYRTLWLEFDSGELSINYFSFDIQSVQQKSFYLSNICTQPENGKVNLQLSASEYRNNLYVSCNGIQKTLYYSLGIDKVKNETFQYFINSLEFPVPKFPRDRNGSTETHIWLGNVQALPFRDTYNPNVKVKRYRNFLGCIVSLTINKQPVAIATNGSHVGELIEPKCQPVCRDGLCKNGATCHERWRKRYQCNCWATKYLGDNCDEDYCRTFQGKNHVKIRAEYKLERLRITFRMFNGKKNQLSGGYKLLTVRFVLGELLNFFIDQNNYLRAQLKHGTNVRQRNQDGKFDYRLEDRKFYNVFLEVIEKVIQIKLMDPATKFTIGSIKMNVDDVTLITEQLIVGSVISGSLDWLPPFSGEITNLILWNSRHQFVWNQYIDYSKMMPCQPPSTTPLSTLYTTSALSDNVSSYLLFPDREKNIHLSALLTTDGALVLTIVGLSFLLVLVLLVIIFIVRMRHYKQKMMKNKFSVCNHKLLHSSNITGGSQGQNSVIEDNCPDYYLLSNGRGSGGGGGTGYNYPNNNDRGNTTMPLSSFHATNSLPPNTPPIIPYKPAYKARSISYSTINRNKNTDSSNTGLHLMPTIVQPEDC